MNASKKTFDKFTIAGFLLVIFLPLLTNILGISTGQVYSENRMAEKLPSFQIDLSNSKSLKSKLTSSYVASVRFINKFDDYYSSSFGLRSLLLAFFTGIKENIFDNDPLPQKVVKGHDGWYFLGDSYSNEIKKSKGIANFSDVELALIGKNMTERKNWLNKNGIRYYIAIAPNKTSAYGEYLPIDKSTRKTMKEQIDSISRNNFELIDLQNGFSAAHGKRLFHKTDSHWNGYGAFLGYVSLIDRIRHDFPTVQSLNLSDFSVDTILVDQQDLTRMLAIRVPEEIFIFTLKNPSKAILQKKQLNVPKNHQNPNDYEQRFKSDVNKLKVLIFHDSFSQNLRPFIKENFGETLFIWSYHFDRDLIAKENPDIVVHIVVERNLHVLMR